MDEMYAMFEAVGDDWIKAKDIQRRTGIKPIEMRALAQKFPDRILGLAKGYRLAEFATREEKQHAYYSLMSRARKIELRAWALRRKWDLL
jgi:hypothetical protein